MHWFLDSYNSLNKGKTPQMYIIKTIYFNMETEVNLDQLHWKGAGQIYWILWAIIIEIDLLHFKNNCSSLIWVHTVSDLTMPKKMKMGLVTFTCTTRGTESTEEGSIECILEDLH